MPPRQEAPGRRAALLRPGGASGNPFQERLVMPLSELGVWDPLRLRWSEPVVSSAGVRLLFNHFHRVVKVLVLVALIREE